MVRALAFALAACADASRVPGGAVVAAPPLGAAALSAQAQKLAASGLGPAELSAFWDGAPPPATPAAVAALSGGPALLPAIPWAAPDRAPLDSGGAVEEPGSIFDWKPPGASPGHGLAPLDALIIGGYRLRGGLKTAMAGQPFWATMPESAGAATPPAPASPEELAFAVQASIELARYADDLGAERGLKAGRMLGADFLAMIRDGRKAYAGAAAAPSPRALAAALNIQDQLVRISRTLLDPAKPLQPQVRRLLSVWDVFNQAMAEAGQKGTLEAIEAEAELFASQVEQSV